MSTFSYTNRDYASIKEDLLARAAVIFPEWTSRENSDFGVLLVDLWAYMGDTLHYYVDRAAREAFLNTATQRSSLLALANLLDYIPSGMSASTSSITINALESGATDVDPILIPAGTRFTGKSLIEDSADVIFTSNRAIAFNGTGAAISGYTVYQISLTEATPVLFTLTQGEIFTEEFVSDGQPGQVFSLTRIGVVGSSVTASVSEGVSGAAVTYSRVSRLISSGGTTPVFVVNTYSDGVTAVTFGNNVYGKIPSVNAVISITYRKSLGSLGNLAPNSINAFESVTNTFGPSYDGLIIIPNVNRAAGGVDTESLESLRINVPASFRSQDRAVSLTDYKDLLLRVANITKATVSVVVGSTSKSGLIVNKALTTNVATLTTSTAHGLTVGESIAVFDVDDTFNGTHVVVEVPLTTTFTYAKTATNVTSVAVSSAARFKNAQIKLFPMSTPDVYDGTLPVGPTTSPLTLSDDTRANVYDYIVPREMVGINSVVIPSVVLELVKVECTINVLPTFVQTTVTDAVKAAIKELFVFDSVSFSQVVTLGTLYRTIMDVDGVDYTNISKFTTATSGVDTVALSPSVQGVASGEVSLLLISDVVVTATSGITVA